jgi:hypothetical protein
VSTQSLRHKSLKAFFDEADERDRIRFEEIKKQ